MAENDVPPVPPANDDDVKSKFQTWMNEVLDEREAKAKAADDEGKNRRTHQPVSIFETLMGKR